MAAPTFTVRVMDWPSAQPLAAPIRMRVFVEDQAVPAEIELDDVDADCEHAIAFDQSGAAIGTGRLLPDGHIGRMAVLAEWRGHGVGRRILEVLMTRAKERGMRCIVLSAQTRAAAFYVKCGFIARGETYNEAGIEHIEMHRKL